MTGDELARRRVALRLTQQQLADELEISRETVSRWEQSHWRITYPRLIDRLLRDMEETQANEERSTTTTA